MGGHPYWYTVDYQEDVGAALEALRTREFRAGRYNPVTPFPDFPIGPSSPAPGAGHASIEDALEASEADGTRSILDISVISDEPDFGASCELTTEELQSLFGTTFPTVEQLQNCGDFWESLERGQARHVLVQGDEGKRLVFFAGYSFD